MGTYRASGTPSTHSMSYLVPWCHGQSHWYLDFSTTPSHPTPTYALSKGQACVQAWLPTVSLGHLDSKPIDFVTEVPPLGGTLGAGIKVGRGWCAT